MKPKPLPPLLATEPFLVDDAVGLVSYERLRRADLITPARGVRASRSLAGRPRVELVARILGANQHFSHTTAARIWQMPVDDDGLIHTTTVGTGTVTRRPGFIGHRVRAADARVDVVGGLPVTARVACWAECSTLVTVDDLVAAGDFLVGAQCGHDVAELEEAVRARRGRRGSKNLKAALAQVCVGSESPRETRVRQQLLRDGFRLPLLNCVIHDELDRFVARPDLIFGRERVCVEYDGDLHRTNRKTYRDDKRRREALADAGWRVLYISDDDLDGPNWVAFVGRLRRALARGEAAAVARAGGA